MEGSFSKNSQISNFSGSRVVPYETTSMTKLKAAFRNFANQTYRHIPAYTKCDVQLIKVAPDDGPIYCETCRASNRK